MVVARKCELNYLNYLSGKFQNFDVGSGGKYVVVVVVVVAQARAALGFLSSRRSLSIPAPLLLFLYNFEAPNYNNISLCIKYRIRESMKR